MIMNLKFLLLFNLFSCALIANNYHNQIVIPSVDIDNPSWEFASQTIRQKNSDSFSQLLKKWNQKLDKVWKKLATQVKTDVNATMTQVDFYLEDQRFIDVYMNYYRNFYGECIDEADYEETDPFILNFIKAKLYFSETEKPIRIYSKKTIPYFAVAFGTDQQGHFLIINDENYTADIINEIYELTIENKTKFRVEPATTLHVSRVIEYSNFYHFIIAQNLANIRHQNDYFSKMLIIFIFNKKTVSSETQSYGTNYIIFQSYLEACLQSKNPYEVAIFVEPFMHSCHMDYIILWEEFIQDLELCYNEQDLAAYKTRALHERRAALFTEQDDDQD